MKWTVLFHDAFATEAMNLSEEVRLEFVAKAKFLAEFGPQLGRPLVDTLKGSKYANMKELRFNTADGVWRLPLIRRDGPFCWLLATSLP